MNLQKEPPQARKTFSSFQDFYPYYLSQHQNLICRRLHFLGTGLVFFGLGWILWLKAYIYLILLPLPGYMLAWIGHFFFEKNKPATFSFFFYSLLGDFVMFKDILLGKIEV